MTVGVIFIVVCFCTIVTPRSIPPDESSLALKTENRILTKVKPEKVEKVIWRKLDAIPRQDSQQPREESTSGNPEEEDLDQLSSNQHILTGKGQNIDLINEGESTSWSDKFLFQTEVPLSSTEEATTDYSDMTRNDQFTTVEDLSRNSSDSMTTEQITDLDSRNFTDSILNILDRTREVLGLQSISEVGNTTESIVFGETDMMNDASDVAVFQDMNTAGFQFLIDSETTQNLILAELLSSESLMLADDGLNDSTNSLSETTQFTLSQEIGSFSDNSVSDINVQIVENKTTLNVIPKNVTEIIETETRASECPPPGWCVIWFMAQDTCAKDSHCLGSLICCKSGCSKTCLDVSS